MALSYCSNTPAHVQSASTAAPAGGAVASSSASKPKRRTFSHYSPKGETVPGCAIMPVQTKKTSPVKHWVTRSLPGYVPFNPNKVNQDRSVEIVKFGNNEEKAFFGIFDGHGGCGHEVSSFLIQELPKFFLKQANLDTNPHEAITKAFIDCNVKLASSHIDCTFSGSTVVGVRL